jgi:hypothetical protein
MIEQITTEQVSLTWKEWEEQFIPISNHLSKDIDHKMFETFGEEWDFVKAQDSKNVWTWLSGDGCDVIVNGFAYVNRLGYFITKNPWDENKDYELIISVEEECSCYQEDGYEDGEMGDKDCWSCEGSGYITKYVDEE